MANEEQQVIVPRYKMIISYDIRPSVQEEYYQFALGELVPSLQEMGIFMTEVWHTAYGDHPMRMISFVTEEYHTLNDVLESDEWAEMEAQLLGFVHNYSMHVIKYKPGFQIT